METSPNSISGTLCVVDDDIGFSKILCKVLRREGYVVHAFSAASEFITWSLENAGAFDLIITDVSMPGISGYDLCREMRAQSAGERIPIVMVTGKDALTEKAKGLDAGADDFIQKPFESKDFIAKINSLLNIRARGRERIERLTKFLSPNLANLVTDDRKQKILNPHRTPVTVMFIDLRGFTSFSEAVEPHVVLDMLNHYYSTVCTVCLHYQATIAQFAGDGIMVFLNDPVPLEHHQDAGLLMAIEVREALSGEKKTWQDRGYNLDFGIGLNEGLATLGGVGFDRFWQYSVIGPVTNVAARLCQMAGGGQILVSERFLDTLEKDKFITEELGEVPIKGYQQPLKIHNVISFTMPFLQKIA